MMDKDPINRPSARQIIKLDFIQERITCLDRHKQVPIRIFESENEQEEDMCLSCSDDDDEEVGIQFKNAYEADQVFQCGMILNEMATLKPYISNMQHADAILVSEFPPVPPAKYSPAVKDLIEFICKENRH